MASHTQFLEQEVKLDVDLTFEVPDLTGVIKGAITDRRPAVDLVATYYDTPDLRLLQRGITLRRRRDRTAGGEDLWTLKLPTGKGTATLDRNEISWPGREPAIPEEAVGLVRGMVRHHHRVAVVVVDRQRVLDPFAVELVFGNRIWDLPRF